MGQSDIDRVLSALASDPSFQDTVVVCQDRQVSAPRVVLALAFPTLMARVLGEGEDREMVVFIPDMLAQEVTERVAALFATEIENQPLHQDFHKKIDNFLRETIKRVDPLISEKADNKEPLTSTNVGNSHVILQETINNVNEKSFSNKEPSPIKLVSTFQSLLHKNTSQIKSSPTENKGNFETTPLPTDIKETNGHTFTESKCAEQAIITSRSTILGMKQIKAEKKFEVTWTCKLCGELTVGKVKHNQHIKTMHQAPDIYSCSFCLKQFKDSRSYNQHVKSHLRLFTCEVCARKFSRLDSLVGHTERKHNKITTSLVNSELKVLKPVSRVSCDKCDFTSRKSAMKKHKEVLHSENNVKCKKCFLEFRDKFILKIEHNQCSGLKCEMSLCDFTAVYVSEMKRHYKYKH